MEVSNLLTKLKTLNARHAAIVSVSGNQEQRLSLLSGAGVVPGALVHDTVSGQTVEVVSTGVVYVDQGVINAV